MQPRMPPRKFASFDVGVNYQTNSKKYFTDLFENVHGYPAKDKRQLANLFKAIYITKGKTGKLELF